MENLCEELDRAKEEMEKLKVECRTKTELCECLKQANNEQLLKFREVKRQNDQLYQDLQVKTEEIAELRKSYEDVKSRLQEKEVSLRHVSSMNDKIRVDLGQKVFILEKEKKEMELKISNMTAKNSELEQKIYACNSEISGLKQLLSTTTMEQKCLDAQQKAKESKERKHKDDVIFKLEDEMRKFEDKLKWKTEQFKHLEEAYEKNRSQFQLDKEEWKRERSSLLEEFSLVQTRLDSQTRILDGVQSRLEMCNQALAHEEGKRKLLEIELNEMKARFDDVLSQGKEERFKVENLTVQKDEEIAHLRNSLGHKETLVREMEFRFLHLEQDNKELAESLKELREAQIHNAGAISSMAKLRNKLRGLEQAHKKCALDLKAKESEWSFEVDKLKDVVDDYADKLKRKERDIEELQVNLKNCNCIIDVLNEEMSVAFLIFKSEFAEIYSKMHGAKSGMESQGNDKRYGLTDELGEKNSSPKTPQTTQEQEELTVLRKRLESLALIEKKFLDMKEEFEKCKTMLEESSRAQLALKQQLLHTECSLEEEKRNTFEAFENVKKELVGKELELSQSEGELQNFKSIMETLKTSYAESLETCKQMEIKLVVQGESEEALRQEKEFIICFLKDQEERLAELTNRIVLLEMTNAEKLKELEILDQENLNLVQIIDGKNYCIRNLQKEILYLKEELVRGEAKAAEQLDNEKAIKQEMELSLEKDLMNAHISFISEQMKRQIEVAILTESLKKAENVNMLEIEEKDMAVLEMEKELNNLTQNIASKEELYIQSMKEVEKLQALVKANDLTNKELIEGQREKDCILEKLKSELGILQQDVINLSSEREDMFVFIEHMYKQIGELTDEEIRLMKTLRNILNISEEETHAMPDLVMAGKLLHIIENENDASFHSAVKRLEGNVDGRLPLKDANIWLA